MTLSKKTYLIVCAAFIGLIAVLSFVTFNILWKGFDVIENDSMKNHVERALSMIDYEYDTLVTTAGDYAGWDETYEFVQNRNENYIKVNMDISIYAQLRINVIVILNIKGEVIYSTGYDRREEKLIPVSPEIMEHFRAGSFLAGHENIKSRKKGILSLKKGGVIIASRPILTSTYSGPIMGTLIMGRDLDEDVVQRWSKLTRTELSLKPFDDKKNILPLPPEISVENISPGITEGRTLIPDVYGKPAYLLSVSMPRQVHLQAQKTIRYLAITTSIIFLVFAFVIIWSLKKSIIARLVKIGQDVNRIGMDTDFSARISVAGEDELTELGSEINLMIKKLEESTSQLKETHNTLYQTNQALLEQIEEKKRSEAALQKSEEKYRLIFEYSPFGLLSFDEKGVIVACNDNFVKIIGSSREKLIGLNMLNLPDKKIVAAVGKALAGSAGFYEDLYHSVTADKITPVRALFAPMQSGDGYILGGGVGIVEDITEKKRAEAEKKKLEEQYRQAQKMEAIGQLAGGVAHDFNNMLNIILGYSQMAQMKIEQSSPLNANLQEIINAAKRSADLVRQLLAFARKQTIAPRELDLNDTITGILNMLRKLIGEDIDLLWMPAANLWQVKMDPAQVDQILANLAVNARDSITGIGKITIETGNVEIDETYCAEHTYSIPGHYAMLTVSDDGCGMDKETIEKIFEPFFTTKEFGKGTGLGLATVYGIVKQNNGFISVYSEPGRGTTFKIYLPRFHGEKTDIDGPDVHAEHLTGTETILFVEDEEDLLKLGKAMLESLGYKALTAGTPGEAVRLAGEHTGDIHLMVTDVVMPEMNGRDLQKKISALRPDMKCLFISGHTVNAIDQRGILDEDVYFLQKPFSINDLAVKVREILEKA